MNDPHTRRRPTAAAAILLALLLAVALGASRGRAANDPARALEQYPSPADVAVSADGAWDPEAIDVIRASLKELGILPTVPDAKVLYNDKFVPVRF